MTTKGDVARYLDEALQHENADLRRDNIVQLSKTRYADHDTVIEACCFIARSDRSASVRVAAIRLVAESLRRDAAVALIDMLDSRDQAASADARVHEEIVNGLYFMQRNGAIPDPLRARVVRTAARLLRGGSSRDVRICAARLLGAYPEPAAVDALIAALKDKDFGVVYHADRSLMQLTGVRHDRDGQAWRVWLASSEEPFAMRGRLDAELEPPAKPRWWQRVGRSVRRAFTGEDSQVEDH